MVWHVGDRPEDHPRWQEQVDLEGEMTTRGADRYWDRFEAARDPGSKLSRLVQRPGAIAPEMTRVGTYQRKLDAMVPRVAAALAGWLEKCRKDRRKAGVGFQHLNHIDPHIAAYIALRVILDRAAESQMPLTDTMRRIGTEIEYTERMRAWLATDPAAYHAVQGKLKEQGATATHRRRVNIATTNRLLEDTDDAEQWPHAARLHVGAQLINAVVRAHPNCFKVEDDPLWAGQTKHKPPSVITISDRLMDELENAANRDALSCPVYMPTIVPPKRWEGMRVGGYHLPTTRRPPLIGFRTQGETERQTVLEEFNALDMSRVLDALNYVQAVPWRINERVLAVAQAIRDQDLGIAGIFKQERKPLPLRPPGFDEAAAQVKAWWQQQHTRDAELPVDIEAASTLVREWKKAATGVYAENARRASKSFATRETLRVAERLRDCEFYFPHHLDFTGRMYPTPVHLQPQGTDLARGLLTFATGREVGTRGGRWLAIHVANQFGKDKLTFDERAAWTHDNEDMLRSIAANPIKDRRWITEADRKKCWQALAAVFEWVRFLDTGPSMVSSLPIHIDGTCNGIQHLSAMMRDEIGGEQVNLIPGDTQRDIYQTVADTLRERLEVIEEGLGKEGLMATMWLDAFGRDIPRSFTKQPVMTLPFGTTFEAYLTHVREWLAENGDPGHIPEDSDQRKDAVVWIAKHLMGIVKETLPAARACMEWIKSCARVLAEAYVPLVWRTPSGFVVRHFYGKERRVPFEVLIDGRRIQPRIYERDGRTLDVRAQLQGIAPNFTHSMDASANTETLIAMSKTGLPVTAIHDAYGTVAAGMDDLEAAVREAFVANHEVDVLAEFRTMCVSMYRDHLLGSRTGKRTVSWEEAAALAEKAIPPPPPRGTLDVRLVLQSPYFFA